MALVALYLLRSFVLCFFVILLFLVSCLVTHQFAHPYLRELGTADTKHCFVGVKGCSSYLVCVDAQNELWALLKEDLSSWVLKVIEAPLDGIVIVKSDPVVSFLEAVLEKSCRSVKSESPNKQPSLYRDLTFREKSCRDH